MARSFVEVGASGEARGLAAAQASFDGSVRELDAATRAAPALRTEIERARRELDALNTFGQRMGRAYLDLGWRAGTLLMQNRDGGFDARRAALAQHFDALAESLEREQRAGLAQAAAGRERTGLWLIGLGTALLIAIGLATLLMYVRVMPPLARLQASLRDLNSGSGDLTRRLAKTANDEVGDAVDEFNRFLDTLRAIVAQLLGVTAHLASAAEETSVIATETNEGVKRQQSETDQVAVAMNEMSATAKDIARNAAHAAGAAREATAQTTSGKEVVARTVDGVNAFATEMQRTAEIIQKLEQDSSNIGTVLDVIRAIAEQTNLLALNAAIEAARAGDQGRGFAVVADEVRALASRTQQSTQEIHQLIEKLQGAAHASAKAILDGRASIQANVEQARQASAALDSITHAVASINDMNTQIASAAEEQSRVAENIDRSVVAISQSTHQGAAGAQQAAAAGTELARLAAELQSVTGKFRI
jgi:methyl-accepting chemotaxis protein